MTKRKYLAVAMTLPSPWLLACIADPSAGMRPIHIALLKIALRRRAHEQ